MCNAPPESDSPVWPVLKDNSSLGIVVDILDHSGSPMGAFFNESLAIKLDDGEIITLSPNLVEKIEAI
jgi:hypothetical protein